jgi:tetratricopeptide (TPR) repeat protein
LITALSRTAGAIMMALLLAAGCAMVAYARWMRPAADGDAALTGGRYEEALGRYAEAEARFDSWAAAKQFFEDDYRHVVAGQLWILHRLQRYDEIVDKAQRAPERTLPHFWSGCAFFEKARAEQKPDLRLAWLTRAEEEFRRAVEDAPGDWDTKYDFELVTKLVAELRKQPKTPPNQLMQLLRPQPKPGAKPVKRVG